MQHKYGEFTENQMSQTKEYMRKSIFFLLLCVDPNTKYQYQHIDVNEAFRSLLYKLGGMSSIFYEPVEIVSIMSLLECARMEYNSSEFNFQKYRKLILDAGCEVLKIKDGD